MEDRHDERLWPEVVIDALLDLQTRVAGDTLDLGSRRWNDGADLVEVGDRRSEGADQPWKEQDAP